MKEQHKEMLRSLKAGEFDAVIERFQSARNSPAPVSAIEPPAVAVAVVPVAPVAAPKTVPPTPPATAKPPSSSAGLSLDEVILSYLMGDDK